MRSLAAALVLLLPAPAGATFHEWQIVEVFSSADRQVQFVEFSTASGLQNFVDDHQVQFRAGASLLNTYTFLANLPLQSTENRRFVIGTPDFEAAAGIAPDFLMDAGFFDPATLDSVVLVGGAPGTTLSFEAGSVPTDGVQSYHRGTGAAPNTPTNFAGQQGSIDLPEPGAGWLGLGAAVALAALAAWAARRATR
jgi:hypothetical protein